MTNNVLVGVKDIGQRLFGGYAELLRIPHTARFSVGSVIACMPFPMVGMTITISVQHYYGNYSLAGALTAVQAIALAVASPVLGKLVDKFGQRQVSIPTIIVWMVAAIALVSCITARVPSWILFCIVPFMAAIPPWGAMSRQRWTTLLKGDAEKTNRALSLSGVFDECMWVIGNPLASTLAVISGLLAFSFTGMCVVIGALMFLTELTTEPKSQTQLAREAGMTRKEYREREAARSKALQAEAAVEYARNKARAEGKTAAEVQAAMEKAEAEVKAGRKESIWGPGLIAVCVTWFGLGAFQSAASISIVAFATEAHMKQFTGFVFACFSFSSLIGARLASALDGTGRTATRHNRKKIRRSFCTRPAPECTSTFFSVTVRSASGARSLSVMVTSPRPERAKSMWRTDRRPATCEKSHGGTIPLRKRFCPLAVLRW